MADKINFLNHLNPTFQNIWNQSGFKQPTTIQEKAIPLILQGKDIIAESPTGTGKTIAYLLPILQKIDVEKKALQSVILAPSRELVMQIYREVQKWVKESRIVGASLVGGANIKRQIDKLKERPQIIVGTPGRILELIKLKKLKMHEVKTMVLDEGDQLLLSEHLNTVRTIVKSAMNERQLLLFSATSVKDVDQIGAMLGRKPELVKVNRESGSQQTNVSHFYLLCEQRERAKLIQKIAAMQGMKALVFVRDVGSMTVLAEKLTFEKVSLRILHSEISKMEREKALKELKSGEVNLMLATDVAARGLDIEGLTHVIHYDFPQDIDQYIHRSGRTGRMGAKGTVISFVTPRELRELRKFGKQLNVPIEQRRIYKGQFVENSKNNSR